MQFIDNISIKAGEYLAGHISANTNLPVASALFSIYAELKATERKEMELARQIELNMHAMVITNAIAAIQKKLSCGGK